jgi:hypothetical protein
MLADLMKTSETQKRISERQERLLGQIGILDWQIKQLSAQQEAKYREIEAMLREQPFIQQLELDLIDKYRDHPQQPPNNLQQAVARPETISQSETPIVSRPVSTEEQAMLDAVVAQGSFPAKELRGGRGTVAVTAKRPTKKAAAKKKPATKRHGQQRTEATAKPAPAPVEAAASAPTKRGRGRPRKQPVAAPPPPPVDITPVHAGSNGANDLDAAFGAM